VVAGVAVFGALGHMGSARGKRCLDCQAGPFFLALEGDLGKMTVYLYS